MKNKSKIALAGAVGLGMLAMTAIPAFADTSTTTPRQGFFQNFMTALASHFNLNITDVQTFFKEQFSAHRAQIQATRTQNEDNRLAQAVTDGKLTQAQADLIKTEQTSVQAELQALKGKTGTDLKTALQSIRTSVQQWAQTNNIPPQFVNFVLANDMGPGMGRGFKIGWFMGRMGHGHVGTSTPDHEGSSTPENNQ